MNKDLKKRIEEALSDSDCVKGSEEYQAAAVLLASAELGPYRKTVADALGYQRDVVDKFADNLESSGVWRDRKIHANWSGDDGAISFWMDVCVALGMMERTHR